MDFNLFRKKINRLKNQRVYLAGAIDRVSDRGTGWRNEITPFLEKMGIEVLNPLKKTSNVGLENDNVHKFKVALKAENKYDELSTLMKNIRSIDLRLVDISDFLIVNIDLDTHPCGTYEEIFWANRQKKPIIIHLEQGKSQTPDWLFGTIPHQMIFSNWEDLKTYLISINKDKIIEDHNRWYFLTNSNS
jgi:nucleoside 2-deoxyribosyltransferase